MTAGADRLKDMRGGIETLNAGIGRTPLYEFKSDSVPEGSRLFLKGEFVNPSGSHYDRVYARLFSEDVQKLADSSIDEVIEVSSGNAGASCALFCRKLDLKCRIILPSSIPSGFESHIRAQNREVIIERAAPGEYLKGAVELLKAKLSDRVYMPNHSRRQETLDATAEIGEECVYQLQARGITRLDSFVVACGNGATVIGTGGRLKSSFPDLRIVAFEPDCAPVGRDAKEGRDQPTEGRFHKLYGTGAWGIKFPFIHKIAYRFQGLVDEVKGLTEAEITKAERLRFWAGRSVGTTSLAGIYVALDLMKRTPGYYLAILYDSGEKYDFSN